MPRKDSIPFNVGDLVSYDGSDDAFIKFVSSHYIVVCKHRTLKTPEEAEHAVSPWREVNVVVPPLQWKHIHPRTQDV